MRLLRGEFGVGSAIAISFGAVVGFVTLLWLIIGCYGRGGASPNGVAERDGGLAVLEGGIQIAQAVVGFEGDCCGGGCGGCGGCGG